MRSRNRDIFLVVLGLGLGLLITTGVFWTRIHKGPSPVPSASAKSFVDMAANQPGAPALARTPPILEASFAVAEAIYKTDYATLAQWASPQGVLFAPYSTVDKTLNLVFTADEIKKFDSDKSEQIWGVYDGTGEPILRTPSEYVDEFLRGDDFTKAPSIYINTIAKAGNSLENVAEEFPGAPFVDFHYPSSENPGGAGWRSLRLVFEQNGTEFKLIAVIHCVRTT